MAAVNAARRHAPHHVRCSRSQRCQSCNTRSGSTTKLSLCKKFDWKWASSAVQWQGMGIERAFARVQGWSARHTLLQRQFELTAAAMELKRPSAKKNGWCC